jgi:hypothetical protein
MEISFVRDIVATFVGAGLGFAYLVTILFFRDKREQGGTGGRKG